RHARAHPLPRPAARPGHRRGLRRAARPRRRRRGAAARARRRLMHRSFLYAPGHNAKLLERVYDGGADAIVLDLEDAVPAVAKETARKMVAAALETRPAWVRVNDAR